MQSDTAMGNNSGGPIPHNMAKTFDGPPTLERSGSEHRRAVTAFPFREGFLSPVRGTERVAKTIEGSFSKILSCP